MAISDRIRELSPAAQTAASPAVSESSTLVAVDPLAKRVSGLLGELALLFSAMQDKDWLTRQMRIIIGAIQEEIEEDSALFSTPMAGAWIVEFSDLMRWTATGDYSTLSPELVRIALKIDGRPEPPKQEPLFYVPMIGPKGDDASH